MMSPHFRLSSELTGSITKRLPHAINQLSVPGSFFNQFVTDIYIYIYTSTALLFEASFDSNNDTFPCFRTFDSATPSNEWECFVKSLLLLHSVHLIYLDQGSANSGPRARCGPRGDFIRPSTLSEIILLFRLFQI